MHSALSGNNKYKMAVTVNKINNVLGMTITLLVIGIVAMNIINSIRESNMYMLSFGVLAEKAEPMQIYDFPYHNFKKGKIMQDGWDDINYSERLTDESPLPDSTTITWFSYKEDRFFKATIHLPSKKMNNIAKDLREETKREAANSGRTEIFYILRFFTELKPEGKVTIWLSTLDIDTRREICTGQGEEIDIDWNKFYPNDTIGRDERILTVLNR